MDLEQYETTYPPRAALPPGAETVRIAPSPTGRPHIGTALQAVINRAVANRTGGVFILRIEDTDRKRLHEGAIDEILAALRWLGASPDEGPQIGGDYGPYFQSERLTIYQDVARWLVERGHAYQCFCTPERLELVRQQQQAAGQPPMYDKHCRWLPADEVARRMDAGEPSVVRLAVPPDTRIAFEDLVRGEIAFDSNTVDDQVLLKSDGFPTYHLAVVVDDHLMRVTTVVRGEEWISSTPKHLLLYQYLGWPIPPLVHTPLLRDASRRKLSKRSGDTSIAWFQTQGYLPEGFRNFLTRIIWTHPEDKDVYPYEDFVASFSLRDLSKTGPVADLDLLDFINGQYVRQLTPDALYAAAAEWLNLVVALDQEVGFEVAGRAERTVTVVSHAELARFAAAFTRDPAYSRRVLALEPERFKKLSDIVLQCGFFFPDLFAAPSAEMLSRPIGSAAAAADALETYRDYQRLDDAHEPWEAKVREHAASAGIKVGKLFMTLRIALTGSDRTPPLYEVIQALGAEEAQRRLDLAIAACRAAAAASA